MAGGRPAPDPLTSEGLAVVHTAAWGWLTRGPERDVGLASAGRELLWATLVLSCLLLWRVAGGPAGGRRCGRGRPALRCGPRAGPGARGQLPRGLGRALAAARRLAGHGTAPTVVRVLGGLAVLPAVVLAPDVLLLLVSGGGRPRRGRLGRRWPATARTVAAGLLAPVFVGLVLLLPVWDPQPDVVAPWSAGGGVPVLLTRACCRPVCSRAWLLPRWRHRRPRSPSHAGRGRPAGPVRRARGLPPGRGAVAGALVQELVAVAAVRRLRPVLAGVATAGLVAALVAATVLVRTGPTDDFGAGDRADLVAWLRSELPPGTTVSADGLLAEDLRQAGVPIGDGGLQVARGRTPTGAEGLVVARFGDAASGLVVADPERRGPDAEERRLRRELSAAC